MADKSPHGDKMTDNVNPDANIETNVDNVNTNVTTDNTEAPAETAEVIDYKAKYEETLAHSRKWETRAKTDRELADKWREYEIAQKHEAERIAEELASLRAEKALLEADKLKSDVAVAKNVPAKLLPFLNGSTREELESQADELLSVLNESAKPKTLPNPEQGKPNGNTNGDTLAAWVEENLL